ncbi:hypothetical protein [Tsukamurella sp. NPDC003166]|uniref:hypothetical protein n=1 Tax=Tsukamurella sp. NPDC003166 TaxID=3154444 RepID=UPI0033A62AE8
MALESGDHIWYYDGQGNDRAVSGEQTSTEANIPRLDWFPTADPNVATSYCDNGWHIYQFVVYDEELRRGQPQMRSGAGTFAWLNNNPGNLTRDGRSYGQFEGKANWHNFMIFPDYDTGFAAIRQWLGNNGYLPRTITQAFTKYAPGGDGQNSPEKYAQDVADAAGVGTDTLLSDLTDDQWALFLNAIEKVEGSVEGTSFAYNDPELPPAIAALVSEV